MTMVRPYVDYDDYVKAKAEEQRMKDLRVPIFYYEETRENTTTKGDEMQTELNAMISKDSDSVMAVVNAIITICKSHEKMSKVLGCGVTAERWGLTAAALRNALDEITII